MDLQDMRDAIRQSPILKNFDIATEYLSVVKHPSGQIIRDHHAGESSVGLICEGLVDVYSVALDGRDVQLNVLRPGDCFGISNLFSQEELQTVLRCKTDASIIYIPKKILVELMRQDSKAAIAYAEYCNRKLQFLIRRIEFLTIQSARGKLIEYLLSEVDADAIVYPDGSREDLAKRLDISRAALFRELSSLYRQNVLQTDGMNFQVKDVQELERLLYQDAAGS